MRAITLAVVSIALMLAASAGAQTPKSAPNRIGGPIGGVLDKIQGDTQPTTGLGGGDGLKNLLAKPFLDLANFIGEDANEAITLATAIPGLQDGHGQQCWIATRKFAAVVKAHPIPLTLKAQTDLQALRLLSMAAKDLCNNVHCTQVFADLKSGVDQLLPVNIPGFGLNFHDVCAKVPTVAVAEPITPVPPDPTPGAAAPVKDQP